MAQGPAKEAPKNTQEDSAEEGRGQEGNLQGSESAEGHQEPSEGRLSPGEDQEDPEDQDGPETFPRAVVEKLRAENADLRVKAKRAEELSARLLAATVREATRGILADPTDLPVSSDLYDEDGWPDKDCIEDAARELVARKPHLAERRPAGPLEQGPRDQSRDVNLAGILRSLAG